MYLFLWRHIEINLVLLFNKDQLQKDRYEHYEWIDRYYEWTLLHFFEKVIAIYKGLAI